MDNILKTAKAPVEVEKPISLIEDALYNSNTAFAGWVNNYGEDSRLRYNKRAAEQDVINGRTFSYSNPDVKERLRELPQGVVESLGTPSSYQEFEAVIARATKANEGIQRLHEDFGVIGSFAAMVPGAILDWDSLIPVGLVGKTKKALDMAQISSNATRAGAYAVAGGAEAYAADAIYQHVMGTDNDTQAFMSLVGGSVLSPIMGKFLLDGATNPNIKVDDPIYGPREPTTAERQSMHVSETELAVKRGKEEIDALIAKQEELLQPVVNKDGTTTTRLDTLKKELSELEYQKASVEKKLKASIAEAKVHAEKEKIVSYKQKEAEAKKAKQELSEHMTSKETIIKDNKKILSDIKKLEAKKDKAYIHYQKEKAGKYVKKPVVFSKAEVKELKNLKKTLTDNSRMIKNSMKTEFDLRNKAETTARESKQARHKVTTKSMKQTLEVATTKDATTKAKELTTKLDTISTKISNTKRKLKISERLLKTNKAALKTTRASVTSKTKQMKQELDEFEEVIAMQRIEDAGEGKLELNWLEKKLMWTPVSKMYKSENPIVRGIASKLYAPYKALKDASGNFIPTRPAASLDKFQIENEWSKTQAAILQEYHEAVKKGEFTGKIQEFNTEIRNNYITSNSEYARNKLSSLGTNHVDDIELQAEIKSLLDAGSISYTKHDSINVNNATKHIADYYKTMAKFGIDSKAKGFDGIITNGYLPRAFDVEAIEAIGKDRAIDILAQALANHPANQRLLDEEGAIRALAEGTINKVGRRNILAQMIDRAGGEQATLSTQKARTLQVYDDDIIELIHSDIAEITGAYSYTMSGRLALQRHFSMSTPGELNAFYDKLADGGVTPDELNNIKATVDTILGTREVMKDPDALGNKAMRILTKANSIIYGPGFALTATTEIANVIATTGFSSLHGTHFDAIKAAFAMARGDKVDAEWVNELQAVGLIGEIVAGRHMQRYDMADSISSSGLIEKHLDLGRNFVFSKLGLAHITEAARAVALGAGMNYIVKLARKSSLTDVERARLARIGISENSLNEVRHLADTGVIRYEGNKLKNFNFDGWSPELQKEIQGALFNHVEATILRPNGATLPLFASDPNSPISKIMLQFMRFPMAMHEQLAMRGFSEFDANTAVGLMSNLMLFSIVAQAKDLGKPDADKRYDLSTKEGQENTFSYIMANNFMSGSILTGADSIYSVISGKQLHSAYSQGTGSLLGVSNATIGSVQRAVGKGMEGDLQDAFTTLQNPVWHLPVLGNYLKAVLGD